MNNKERFVSILRSVRRDGVDELLQWLDQTDFYTAPASSRYHGSYEGGLLEHSLNVYDELVRLLNTYSGMIGNIDSDSVAISALLHDLCKANMYIKEKRNRKNEFGQWESYDAYTIKEDFCFGGHGSKSVYIASRFIRLSPDEATAINCHMGAWDGNKDVNRAYEACPLAWLLHVADEAATYIKEGKVC